MGLYAEAFWSGSQELAQSSYVISPLQRKMPFSIYTSFTESTELQMLLNTKPSSHAQFGAY